MSSNVVWLTISSIISIAYSIIITTSPLVLGIFIVSTIYGHRWLGHLLNQLLVRPNDAFKFTCSWAGVRIGLDAAEIVLFNVIWHNPGTFKGSPFFASTKRMTIRFNFQVGAVT
jgi:hypothetical protein